MVFRADSILDPANNWITIKAVMKLLKKLLPSNGIDPTKPADEWIAVYFKLSNGEYGTEEERDSIHRFTDKLSEIISESGMGIFDGDEFGNGEGGLFMYGPNADRLFNVVEPSLRGWKPLEGGYAIKRYGAPAGQSERIEF